LISTSAATKTSETSSAGGPPPSKSWPKYEANPAASEPDAAKLADRKDTVTRKVRALLPKAFWT